MTLRNLNMHGGIICLLICNVMYDKFYESILSTSINYVDNKKKP